MKVLSPGALIGKYPVTRLLSAGGMGMVYEAVHPILGSRVAIKTIRPELAHDARVVDRFFKEALATSRIRDERLPQIFDQARLPDDTPYMVMELLEGEDLAQRLAQCPQRRHVLVFGQRREADLDRRQVQRRQVEGA